jgi:glycerophosphoryl diester phosphodiesterase
MRVDLQGHRGARGLAPENTLPGFLRALAIGVTTLELDCGVSRDGVVVIHHDRCLNPDIARGPDGEWIRPPGPRIRELSFAELQRYDVGRLRPGSDYAERFPEQRPLDGTRIPRLSALLERASAPVRFNIETKIAPETSAEPFVLALLAEVRAARVAERTTIQSFDWRTLEVVSREAPDIARSYLTEGDDADPEKVRAAGGRIWSPEWRTLGADRLADARRLGLKVIAWTLNEPADIARALDMELDGIISDYPDRVRAEMARRALPLPPPL